MAVQLKRLMLGMSPLYKRDKKEEEMDKLDAAVTELRFTRRSITFGWNHHSQPLVHVHVHILKILCINRTPLFGKVC